MLPLVKDRRTTSRLARRSRARVASTCRAREEVKQSLDICQKKGVLGSGYIPKVHQTTCQANSEGLFAYYQYAEAGFILTCRTPDGGGSGWSGITGVKDTTRIDAAQLTEIASDKAVKRRRQGD